MIVGIAAACLATFVVVFVVRRRAQQASRPALPVAGAPRRRCPACEQTFAPSALRVAPVLDARGRYHGTALCETDWRAALATEKARFETHPDGPETDPAVELLVALLACGVTPEQLHAYTFGSDPRPAAAALLAAIEVGAVSLSEPTRASAIAAAPADPGSRLCSTCLQTFAREQIHVVPSFVPELARYVGSTHCDADWKRAVLATRIGFLQRAATDPDFESGALLMLLVARGIERDALRVHTTGRTPIAAIEAVLDEIEAGRIELRDES